MLKYIVYLDPVGLPRVTTAEFADQINEDAVIDQTYSLDGSVLAIVRWYEDQAEYFLHLKTEAFKALMGVSDVNE